MPNILVPTVLYYELLCFLLDFTSLVFSIIASRFRFLLFVSDQVQSNQPEENTVYYQNSYESQPYGSSYSMPFTYSTVTPQAGKPTGRADNSSVHYGAPISDLTPVSIDLVKKRLQDR